MNDSKKFPVLLAAAAVLILAGVLGVRVLGSSSVPAAPAATVGQPDPVQLATLEIPAWQRTASQEWSIDFKTDLDRLAPLGTGSGNAAQWFALFEKDRGPRAAEAESLLARRVDNEQTGKIVPFDDPLLVEAEPWCDQAEMRFYPDVYPMEGWETRITNLIVPLSFARTWVARGLASEDPASAMEDFRRSIRLGRLFRQDDAVIINDLIGLECIRLGAWGIFEYNKLRDPELALLASVVVGEAAPQKLLTAERVTKVSLSPYARKRADGGIELTVSDDRLKDIEEMIATSGDRRFKAEALFAAQLIVDLGTPEQQRRMGELMDELATADDPILRSLAQWVRTHPMPAEEIVGLQSD